MCFDYVGTPPHQKRGKCRHWMPSFDKHLMCYNCRMHCKGEAPCAPGAPLSILLPYGGGMESFKNYFPTTTSTMTLFNNPPPPPPPQSWTTSCNPFRAYHGHQQTTHPTRGSDSEHQFLPERLKTLSVPIPSVGVKTLHVQLVQSGL